MRKVCKNLGVCLFCMRHSGSERHFCVTLKFLAANCEARGFLAGREAQVFLQHTYVERPETVSTR